MPELDPSVIAAANAILDSPSESAALTVHSERVIRAVTGRDLCTECSRDYGHTPECPNHYSRNSTPACYSCRHGAYGPTDIHHGCVWQQR